MKIVGKIKTDTHVYIQVEMFTYPYTYLHEKVGLSARWEAAAKSLYRGKLVEIKVVPASCSGYQMFTFVFEKIHV